MSMSIEQALKVSAHIKSVVPDYAKLPSEQALITLAAEVERVRGAGVPAGWRLVPVRPTVGMCIAGDDARMTVDDMTRTPAIYRAMLAAAPAAPEPAPAVSHQQWRAAVDKLATLRSFLLGWKGSRGCVANEMETTVQQWVDGVGELYRLYRETDQPAPADPMDWPLPCDVQVGHGTHGKGTKLRSLVARMQLLYDMTQEAQPAPATAPLQGGLNNAELASAWLKKLPGVKPSDRDLTAFAIGVEVGRELGLLAAAQAAQPDAAQPAPAVAQPQPLTDELVAELVVNNQINPAALVRATERAHGIGEGGA